MFASFLTGSCSGQTQTITYENMKDSNVKIPIMMQYLNGLNILMEKNAENSVCLTKAYKGETDDFSPLNGEFNPVISYELRTEDSLTQLHISITNTFILEADGRYRIMESSYINSIAHRESEANMWTEDRLTSPQPSEPRLIGYSDDTTLYAMRILDYIYEHRVEPVVYNENQVNQQPVVYSSNNQFVPSATEKEIEKWLHNPPEYYLDKLSLKGIKGKIKLSYLIDEYGQAVHIKVEQTTINKPESMPGICGKISTVLRGIRWQPAQLDGKAVVMKRNITIKI